MDGFLGYAQQLRTPTIYDAVEQAERVSEVARYGFPASVFRHFERLEDRHEARRVARLRRHLQPLGLVRLALNNFMLGCNSTTPED